MLKNFELYQKEWDKMNNFIVKSLKKKQNLTLYTRNIGNNN